MFYIEWTEQEIDDLGMNRLVIEVDPSGIVRREIGLDSSGNVIHKAPTAYDNYGQFDLQRFETSNLQSELSSEEFERLWHLPFDPEISIKKNIFQKLKGWIS